MPPTSRRKFLHHAAAAALAAGLARRAGLATDVASYRAIATADRFNHAASIFPPGGLFRFDLQEVAAAVAPRRLTLLAPADHLKRPAPPADAQEIHGLSRATYGASGGAGRFSIVPRKPGADLADQCLNLL